MITISEYAKKHDISYEAARKLVARHEKELEGHISIQNNMKFISEEGEAILTEYRRKAPIVMKDESRREQFELMKDELEQLRLDKIALLEKLDSIRDMLEDANKKVYQIEQKESAMRTENEHLRNDVDKQLGLITEYQRQIETALQLKNQLEADRERIGSERDRLNVTNMQLKRELDEAREEAESYEKSFFGFYKKKKK